MAGESVGGKVLAIGVSIVSSGSTALRMTAGTCNSNGKRKGNCNFKGESTATSKSGFLRCAAE